MDREKNENGARRQVLEDLFYDFNKSRVQVYWMNFVRGTFFGFGTVLGGTVVVAIIIWILGLLAGWLPFGDYIRHIIEAFQRR